jgi:hypothetical protein
MAHVGAFLIFDADPQHLLSDVLQLSPLWQHLRKSVAREYKDGRIFLTQLILHCLLLMYFWNFKKIGPHLWP